jgi:hypothetical protein
MGLTFVQVPAFVAEWRMLKLADEDLQALETAIMERPEAGNADLIRKAHKAG